MIKTKNIIKCPDCKDKYFDFGIKKDGNDDFNFREHKGLIGILIYIGLPSLPVIFSFFYMWFTDSFSYALRVLPYVIVVLISQSVVLIIGSLANKPDGLKTYFKCWKIAATIITIIWVFLGGAYLIWVYVLPEKTKNTIIMIFSIIAFIVYLIIRAILTPTDKGGNAYKGSSQPEYIYAGGKKFRKDYVSDKYVDVSDPLGVKREYDPIRNTINTPSEDDENGIDTFIDNKF